MFTRGKSPADIVAQLEMAKDNGKWWWMKAVALAHTSSQREAAAKATRSTKKEDANTVMTGVDTSPGNIAQTVRNKVAKALQSQRKKLGNKDKASPPICNLPTDSTRRKKKNEIQTLAAQTQIPNHEEERE